MTTETVCVPRELLLELRDTAYAEAQQYHIAMKNYRNHEHDRLDQIVAEVDALLAQSVASEPVAICNAYDVDWLPGSEHLKEGDKLYPHPLAPAIPEGYVLVPIDSKLGHICGFTRFMDGACMVCGNTEGSTDE